MPVYTEELVASHFYVSIDEDLVAVFKECSGMNGEIEVETFQEGGLNTYEHKLPGRVKYGNLTLRSGVANTVPLWNWFSKASTGQVERKDITIVAYDQDRGESMRWDLMKAYPVRWQGPDFKADDNSVAVHSIELAHNGVKFRKLRNP